jgi:hypothetical protein
MMATPARCGLDEAAGRLGSQAYEQSPPLADRLSFLVRPRHREEPMFALFYFVGVMMIFTWNFIRFVILMALWLLRVVFLGVALAADFAVRKHEERKRYALATDEADLRQVPDDL